MKSYMKFGLAAAVSLIALEASAGGFGVREQSAISQGASFAGAATSAAGLSGMYWNPAIVTTVPGMNAESHVSGIFGFAKLTPISGVSAPAAVGGTGNLGIPALVGTSYYNYQVNDRLFLGLSINAPYGLKTQSNYNWSGQLYGRSSKALNMLFTPTIGFKVNDWLAVGAGLQIGYFDVNLKGATPSSPNPRAAATALLPNSPNNILDGDGWSAGYTLGATITPFAGTEIGIGFRSMVHYDLKGTVKLPYAVLPIKAKVNLPEMLTIGLRQQINDKVTMLAGFEWTNWSRVHRAAIRNRGTGAPISQLAFDYKDGYLASLGGEYRWDDRLLLRAGLAYEWSPTEDATRSVRIPDNDRIWASLGATYKWNDRLTFDGSYTHIFVKDPDVAILPGHHDYRAGVPLVAKGKAHVDIISFSMRYSFNPPPPPVSKSVATKG